MDNFKFYEERIGLPAYTERPEPKNVWYAYKEGQVIGIFDTFEEARQHSKIVERVVKNKDAIDEFDKTQRYLYSKALEAWKNDLYQENYTEYLNKDILDICYSKAYEDGHSSGYDEVALYMEEYCDMAESVIKSFIEQGKN